MSRLMISRSSNLVGSNLGKMYIQFIQSYTGLLYRNAKTRSQIARNIPAQNIKEPCLYFTLKA